MRAAPYLAGLWSGALRTARAPADLAVRLLFYVVILVVFSALWQAAVEERGTLGGYTFPALLWYVAAAEAAVVAANPRLIEEIGDEIGSGEVAIALLRPVSLVLFRAAVELGQSLVRLVGLVVAAALVVAPQVGAPPDPGATALALVALPVAVAANVAAQHAFAATAFWLQDAKASWFLYQKLIFLLGGMLLPLELLPDALGDVARVLPFAAMSYVPGRLASGHVAPGLLVVQALWLAAAVAAAVLVFGRGQRRLQLVGG